MLKRVTVLGKLDGDSLISNVGTLSIRNAKYFQENFGYWVLSKNSTDWEIIMFIEKENS